MMHIANNLTWHTLLYNILSTCLAYLIIIIKGRNCGKLIIREITIFSKSYCTKRVTDFLHEKRLQTVHVKYEPVLELLS